MKEINEADKFCKDNKLTGYELSHIKGILSIKYYGFKFNSIYELDLFVDFLDKIEWEK